MLACTNNCSPPIVLFQAHAHLSLITPFRRKHLTKALRKATSIRSHNHQGKQKRWVFEFACCPHNCSLLHCKLLFTAPCWLHSCNCLARVLSWCAVDNNLFRRGLFRSVRGEPYLNYICFLGVLSRLWCFPSCASSLAQIYACCDAVFLSILGCMECILFLTSFFVILRYFVCRGFQVHMDIAHARNFSHTVAYFFEFHARNFGHTVAYFFEFQERGVPHIHGLIFPNSTSAQTDSYASNAHDQHQHHPWSIAMQFHRKFYIHAQLPTHNVHCCKPRS